MQLTSEGHRIVNDLAQRHGVSQDAVITLLMAIVAGQGTQAQFSHPDLGGMGQWSQGGMIMVGDMFNNALKYRVDALCADISNLLQSSQLLAPAQPAQSQSQSQSGGASGVSLFVPGSFSSSNWWPSELGAPGSTGAQNNLRYAFFPVAQRLAIDIGGTITVYDTGDHQISGFSQQQSGDQSITFTSQYGLVRVADLPVVDGAGSRQGSDPKAASAPPPISDKAGEHAPEETAAAPIAPLPSEPEPEPTSPPSAPSQPSTVPPVSADDIFAKIERLAELHGKGILTDQEFDAKKTDLLSRL